MSLTRIIQPLGTFFEIDADGYVINPCHESLIQEPWQSLVKTTQKRCVETLGSALHSLYLRGSIPRGLGIPNVSDLDIIAVLQDSPIMEQQDLFLSDQLADLKRQIGVQFSFCTGVEVLLTSLSGIQDPRSTLRGLLKTQTLCLYGSDLRNGIPFVRPGPGLISHAKTLHRDIASVVSELRSLSAKSRGFENLMKRRCGWVMRRIVRSGFELVMEKDGSFTRDLYPCYIAFSRYYPEQQQAMYKALELAISPSLNRSGLLIFLEMFGGWILREIDSVFITESHLEKI